MRFEFNTANRIVFGPGTVAEVPALAAGLGRRFFVVTGRNARRAAGLFDGLERRHLQWSSFSVTHEPTIETALAAVAAARKSACDGVIGIGGGSGLDTGKVVAAMLTNSGDLFDYLEVVGRGQALKRPSAPYTAIPTTAGTGAEVTRNAVLGVADQGVKVSMRSPVMMPLQVVVDPELMLAMPPAVTAATGMDALTQLLEAYVSRFANPVTDGFCREGLLRAAWALTAAYENGENATARSDMALAALFSGLALANAGLGAVHGIAGPLGGMISAPHGMLCARLLPFVAAANLKALNRRKTDSPALLRYAELAQILTGNPGATATESVAWIEELCHRFSIPRLAEWGLTRAEVPELVQKAQRASSMRGNPVALTEEELTGLIEKAL